MYIQNFSTNNIHAKRFPVPDYRCSGYAGRAKQQVSPCDDARIPEILSVLSKTIRHGSLGPKLLFLG